MSASAPSIYQLMPQYAAKGTHAVAFCRFAPRGDGRLPTLRRKAHGSGQGDCGSPLPATFWTRRTGGVLRRARLRTGAEVLFSSADDPDGLRGPNLSDYTAGEHGIMATGEFR
jgi:hypothetical protein